MFNLGTCCGPNPGTMNMLGGVTHRGVLWVGVTHLELDGDELFDERVDKSEDRAAGP